jgi:hypothetical protein
VERSKVATPEFAKLITQGIAEGVFETDYVQETAENVYAISLVFTDMLVDILLNPDNYDDPEASTRRKITVLQTTIERVLATDPGSSPIMDKQTKPFRFLRTDKG